MDCCFFLGGCYYAISLHCTPVSSRKNASKSLSSDEKFSMYLGVVGSSSLRDESVPSDLERRKDKSRVKLVKEDNTGLRGAASVYT